MFGPEHRIACAFIFWFNDILFVSIPAGKGNYDHGEAYSELNKKEDAIASYKKAAETFEEDENNSSEYLFRAGLLAETTGNANQALELYKQLKDKFPRTEKGFQADKYINRLSIEKN